MNCDYCNSLVKHQMKCARSSEFFFLCTSSTEPYTGLGQIQLKLKDLKSSLSNFEKVLEVYPENVESLKVSWKSTSILFYFASKRSVVLFMNWRFVTKVNGISFSFPRP